jgi:integrase
VTLRAFERTIAPSHFLEATPVDVEEFLAAHIAPRTRHAYRSDLKCFYAWAIRRRLATSNPAAETDSVRLPKLLPRPVGPELIAALIVTAPAEWVGTALALAAYAGLRRSEIANLTTGDLSFVSRPPMLTVRNGKGGKDRRVPVHPELMRLLVARRPSGLVVPRSPDTIGDRCAAHLRASGIDATLHQLRHTFGTEFVRAADGNVVLGSKVMGHSEVSTTMGYVGWDGGEAYDVITLMFRDAS